MEFRQLKYFEAVARTLNFSRAAEELHIAQPPLSRQIQNLEDELGVILIDRSSRPLKLTEAGVFFYNQSTQLLAKIKEVKKTTQRIGTGQNRWMGIGFVASILYSPIPSMVQEFRKSHANIDVSLDELTSVEQVKALISGKIDIGFGRLAVENDAIENILLDEEKLALVISPTSPFYGAQSLFLKDIIQETLILYPSNPRPSFADHVLRQFQVRSLSPADTYETNGVQTAIGLVAAGMGVTLVPESMRLLKRPDIEFISILDSGVTTPLIMSVRKNDVSDHISAFCQRMQERFI